MLAFNAVMRDALRVNRSQSQIRTNRLLKRWEHDERLKPMKPFAESWNYWRERYAKHEYESTWMPKSTAQITLMENIMEICAENKIDLDIMVACGHRAFAKSRYGLSLSMLCAKGLEFFAQHHEEVLVEIDEEAYQRKAADEWRPQDED